jgi:hypothetical protein
MATATNNLTWTGALNAVKTVGDAIGQVGSAITSGINATSSITGLLYADAAASRQEAAAYYEQGLYQVQAADTLRLAQIRADQDRKYASIQAGRKLQAAQQTMLNYVMAGNGILRDLERTNASARARAAASGVVYNEGSARAVQVANVGAAYRDIGVSDLNALTAHILGFEDASAMLLAGMEQADVTINVAVKSGRTMAGVTRQEGLLNFAKTYTNPFA